MSQCCSVIGCNRTILSKGLCKSHYRILRNNGGDFSKLVPLENELERCIVDGCDRDADSKKLCTLHYLSNRRYNTPPEEMKPIKEKRWVTQFNYIRH